MQWTAEQQKVIELRDKDILVSAAAGSGKTAVLVERILRRVTDPDPKSRIDVDELLVVTFTRAAAAEMRERIGKALERALAENPEDEHLQRQNALLLHARISTIHGFCTHVIQNYYHRIDLDPVYRIADEGELRMIQGDVLSEMLEEKYAEEDRAFLSFADAYAPGKKEKKLEELILELYRFAEANPDPEGWILSVRESVSHEDPEESPWMKVFLRDTREILSELAEECRELLSICREPEGPALYEPAILSDLVQLEKMLSGTTYRELQQAISAFAAVELSRKRPKDISKERKEQVNYRCKAVREHLQKTLKVRFRNTVETLKAEQQLLREPVEVLCGLTLEFGRRFGEKKREKGLMSFGDLEHFALQILRKDGEPTEAAAELAASFKEVMIDEYQDSNYLQEALLSAVAGMGTGVRNRFMVGDMKQGIYRFRRAEPRLFLEKYNTYQESDASGQRIDLHSNFRSRHQVLDSVNDLFRRIMQEKLGGICYDDAAALHPGAAYPDPPFAGADDTEILLLDKKDEGFEGDTSKTALMEAEAAMTADRIEELMRTMQVRETVKENGEERSVYRPLRYRDIVILFRATNGWADSFVKVLTSRGIPAYAISRTGYYSAPEIVTVLHYLRILDNPRQEIPFAAVLKSPMVNVTDRELAAIRCFDRKLPLYEAAARYAVEGSDAILRSKLLLFGRQYQSFRDKVFYLPVHALIRLILKETGYGAYAAALPAGEQRTINLEMLVQKAVDYANTSYHGLFSFIRYLEQMEKYKLDEGEGNPYSEGADTVRIMTIHKSKGLEFPVVFVSGLHHRFNTGDQKSALALHSEYGIAMNVVRLENRSRTVPLQQKVIRDALKTEQLAEELRILYVALTRAKEKLILTGSVSDLRKTAENLWQNRKQASLLSYRILTTAANYWDWILPAFAGHTCMKGIYMGWQDKKEEELEELTETSPVHIKVMTPPDLEDRETGRMQERRDRLREKLQEIRQAERLAEEEPEEQLQKIRQAERLAEAESEEQLQKMKQRDEFPETEQSGEQQSSELKEKQQETEQGGKLSEEGGKTFGTDIAAHLQRLKDWTYPNPLPEDLPSKVSVSYLKHQAMVQYSEGEGEAAVLWFTEEGRETGSTAAGPLSEEEGREAGSTAAGSLSSEEGREAGSTAAGPLSREEGREAGSTAAGPLNVEEGEKEESKGEELPDFVPTVPAFIRRRDSEQETASPDGAARGTAYHRFLECLEYQGTFPETIEGLREQAAGMIRAGKMTEEDVRLLNFRKLQRFAESDLYRAMKEADRKGTLVREQAFTFAMPASLAASHWPSTEDILVQGVIDAYYEKDGTFVIVDYKTDRVKEPEELLRRYTLQLQLYRRALEMATGEKVSELWIYSVFLGKSIPVPPE